MHVNEQILNIFIIFLKNIIFWHPWTMTASKMFLWTIFLGLFAGSVGHFFHCCLCFLISQAFESATVSLALTSYSSLRRFLWDLCQPSWTDKTGQLLDVCFLSWFCLKSSRTLTVNLLGRTRNALIIFWFPHYIAAFSIFSPRGSKAAPSHDRFTASVSCHWKFLLPERLLFFWDVLHRALPAPTSPGYVRLTRKPTRCLMWCLYSTVCTHLYRLLSQKKHYHLEACLQVWWLWNFLI